MKYTAESFWEKVISSKLSSITFPYQKKRPVIRFFNYDEKEISLELNKKTNINYISDQQIFTLSFVSLCVFLKRFNNDNNITVGTFALTEKEMELVPICCDFSDIKTMDQAYELVNQALNNVHEHLDYNFHNLFNKYRAKNNTDIALPFRILLVPVEMENFLLGNKTISSNELNAQAYYFNMQDLILFISKHIDGIVIKCRYNADLYYNDYIANLLDVFGLLIQTMFNHYVPNLLLSEISLLTNDRMQQLIYGYNQTYKEYPKNKCVHELFEEIVEHNKDKIALVYNDQQLTYEVLNQKANQLAHYLRRNKVSPETLVGISVYRSLELIIGLLGILKSGGAYVPLDPEQPKDRLEYMLKDAGIMVLLTTTELKGQFKEYKGKVVCLDNEEYLKEPVDNLHTESLANNLAYVIYTSGSTGRPKGTAIPHYALTNRLEWQQKEYKLKPKEVILHKSSIGFDVSVWELLWSYIVGAKLVVTPLNIPEELDKLSLCIKQQRVTTTHFVPALLSMFSPYINNYRINFIICSGEALAYETYKEFNKRHKETKVYNLYGPTEATIDVSHYTCKQSEQFEIIPIGTPIYNTQIHILDEYLNLVPVGSAGEIYIGGVGLARGYLNRPSLTAEKFIPNPFINNKESEGARLYKTGDLGRYLEDGDIEFLGRIDYQVKLRGFRIELGEIESTIQGVPGIKQCVVLAREDIATQKRLVAYIVLCDGAIVSKDPVINNEVIANCREVCKAKLPDYMQPSQIMVLENLPLTLNGKVDRKALPAPEGREGLNECTAPIGLLEEQLAYIWKDILKIEKIGRNDNFFSLGGDSILLTQVLNEIVKLGYSNITIVDLFNYHTIRLLAGYLKQGKSIELDDHPKTDNDYRINYKKLILLRNRRKTN